MTNPVGVFLRSDGSGFITDEFIRGADVPVTIEVLGRRFRVIGLNWESLAILVEAEQAECTIATEEGA